MSRPIDIKPLLRHVLQIETRTGLILDGVDMLKGAAAVNQDNAEARAAIAQLGTEICLYGYKLTRHVDDKHDSTPAAEAEPVVLPTLPRGVEMDRLIHAGTMQHIADLSRFTANLSRCSTPAARHKVARLIQEFAENLADQMQVELDT